MPDVPYQAGQTAAPPLNPLLMPHGQIWVDDGEVNIDAQDYFGRGMRTFNLMAYQRERRWTTSN